MLRWILEQEEAIRNVFSMDTKTTHLLPTWQYIAVIKSIDEALSPLTCLTDMLSGEEYVTVCCDTNAQPYGKENFEGKRSAYKMISRTGSTMT